MNNQICGTCSICGGAVTNLAQHHPADPNVFVMRCHGGAIVRTCCSDATAQTSARFVHHTYTGRYS